MKNVFLTALFAIVLAGCQTQKTDVDYVIGTYKRSANKGDALVEYRNEPIPFTFWVDGRQVGSDLNAAVETVKGLGANGVRLRSEYQLVGKTVNEFVRRFETNKIEVIEFWVPSASAPGSNDLVWVSAELDRVRSSRGRPRR
jgi:hypothetical protein